MAMHKCSLKSISFSAWIQKRLLGIQSLRDPLTMKGPSGPKDHQRSLGTLRVPWEPSRGPRKISGV